jgi:hypothetical protein
MSFPVFASGDVLNASDMNAVGLWLVKSQAIGTGVSSVSVTAAFSADYDAYKIVISSGVASAAVTNVSLRLGASTTGYYSSTFFAGVAAATVANAGVNNGANWTYGGLANSSHIGFNLDLVNPFLAKYTLLSNATYQDFNSPTYGVTNGLHAVNTSYTDFTIAPGSGTLTGGTIFVYGYKK